MTGLGTLGGFAAVGALALAASRRAAFVADVRAQIETSATAIREGIDNTPPPEIAARLDRLAPIAADLLRAAQAADGRAVITSGYRCKAVNDLLSASVPDSLHMQGLALDISGAGWEYKDALACSDVIAAAVVPPTWAKMLVESHGVIHFEFREP